MLTLSQIQRREVQGRRDAGIESSTCEPQQQSRSQVSNPPWPLIHHLTSGIRIKNPLAGIPQAALLDQVEEFAHTRGLTKILPLLRKGALVARDPSNYEDIEGAEALNDAEIEALRDEVLHKWRQPLALYFTIVTCSVGAAVQGWDQTGALLSATTLFCREAI